MTSLKGADPYAVAETQLADLFAATDQADACYPQVCAVLHEAIPTYTWVGIAMLVGQRLTLLASQGPTPHPASASLHPGISEATMQAGTMIVVHDVRAELHYRARFPSTRAEIAVPIRDAVRLYGVLTVASDHRGAFGLADQSLLTEVAAALALRASTMAW